MYTFFLLASIFFFFLWGLKKPGMVWPIIKQSTLSKVMLCFFIPHICPIVLQSEIADVRQTLLGILYIAERHTPWMEQADLFIYRAWLLITHCCLYKKVTRQQFYGMPTGSVIVWFSHLKVWVWRCNRTVLSENLHTFVGKYNAFSWIMQDFSYFFTKKKDKVL